MHIYEAPLFILLGIFAGILAGLFGIGGGVLVVPGLLFLFKLLDFPDSVIMRFAIATSLGIMSCTALSSVWAHHRHKNIEWALFGHIIPGIIFGTIAGALLTQVMHSRWLELLFGLFLIAVSIKMFFGFHAEETHHKMPNEIILLIVGSLIGFKSGLLGIGGGSLSVPFLKYCGLSMRKAAGTSATFTLTVALTGSITFLLSIHGHTVPGGTTGYLYWPAFLLVAPFTAFFAPVGAKLSTHLPDSFLRKLFSVLLFCVSAKLLIP